MIRFYLVPVVVGVNPLGAVRGPKYFAFGGAPAPAAGDPALVPLAPPWAFETYGTSAHGLVAAEVSDPNDAVIRAVPSGDVIAFADNLDQALGANLATMQAGLEAINLPGQMLGAGTTYRQVLRGVRGLLKIAQCMQGKGRNIFAAGVTFATTMGSIAQPARDDLSACVVALGFDISGVTGATTVRQLLTGIANTASPSPMLGITI